LSIGQRETEYEYEYKGGENSPSTKEGKKLSDHLSTYLDRTIYQINTTVTSIRVESFIVNSFPGKSFWRESKNNMLLALFTPSLSDYLALFIFSLIHHGGRYAPTTYAPVDATMIMQPF
jgi:hypothetical protein